MLAEDQDPNLDDSMDGGLEGEGLLDSHLDPEAARAVTGTDSQASSGMCGCFTVGYYKPFFDVDTVDVYQRVIASYTFYKKEPTFLNMIGSRPDAYGPFWIATTLIFIISVTSNLARSLKNGYNYDFELVTSCVSLVYGYLGLMPLTVWAACKYFLGVHMSYMNLVCLFGYGLFHYVPSCILCPVTFLAWPMLILAATASTLFVLRSLMPILSQRKEKAMTLLPIFVGMQLIFMLFVKFRYYNHS